MVRLSAMERRDMQRLIALLMDSPVNSNIAPKFIDGKTAISQFKKANVDVKTRILLQASIEAMKGDKQWAQFLFKYGGFEPVKEEHMTMETPTIVDDLSPQAKVALHSAEIRQDEPQQNQ